MTAPLAYPLAEAAKAAGVSIDTLRKAIRATEPPYLRAKKAGTKWLIKASDLADWLDSLPDA